MTIQSSLFIIIFVLAGLLLLGLIIFLVIYFSRSSKKTEVNDKTTPLSEVIQQDKNVIPKQEMDGDASFTKLVTLGRAIKNDGFAILFGDEWIGEASQLTLVQRNRLEKNLAEAQQWLGVEMKPAPLPYAKIKEDKPVEVVATLAPTKNAEKHKRQLSIVEQVDEVLQDLLEDSLLNGRKIRLTEMPDKGVTVWVENEHFDGINSVPDEEVKGIIQQAVRKWEKTSGK